jgi:membrane-bound transcription factor site-1 protease
MKVSIFLFVFLGFIAYAILTEQNFSQYAQTSVVENEFIVGFRSYMSSEDQRKQIENIIGHDGWHLIHRNNPASALPSDFALIQVSAESVVNKLKVDNKIKYLVPQKRYTNIINELDSVLEEDLTFKAHGKLHSNFPDLDIDDDFNITTMRRKLHDEGGSITDHFKAQYLWDRKITGKGIKVAVFDTGIYEGHSHFNNIAERTDWTDEDRLDDTIGHGTFVAGVIASTRECLGFAPDADIYAFRVFTSEKVSYTSWFLDAFNYAISKKINVLNLSIGGPDFMDLPFVEKVWEMSANNIIVVSAIGNDGPLYGTLNNPADQLDVIGVGGIDFKDKISRFSSRGMTTWELPHGYGRVKPDIVSYSVSVRGPRIEGGCRVLSGTSVASPVVAGAITLLASSVPEDQRDKIVNPASMRQVLIEGSHVLQQTPIFEQGMGRLDLMESYALLNKYKPRASFLPPALDLTSCPYMWPFCTQSLYYSSMPVVFNVTILNGLGVTGRVVNTPRWISGASNLVDSVEMVQVSFRWSEILWPWTGWISVHLQASPKAAKWQGSIEGYVEVDIESPSEVNTDPITTTIKLPVKINVIPTPPKAKRVLWDQYHNMRYPPGYLPRDSLSAKHEPFDWNGDHLHTNFKQLYDYLRSQGYYIEVLGQPYTCFNASNYGTLLIVDTEDEFFPAEIEKLEQDIKEGLSIAVFADWYNVDLFAKIKFFDENTKQWWTPITGGANVPALNDLLRKYGIQFGDRVYDGQFSIGSKKAIFSSGNAIASFPAAGVLVPAQLQDQSLELLESQEEVHKVPILGLYTTQKDSNDTEESLPRGRIAVFGDSSCLDSANRLNNQPNNDCFWLLKDVLMFTGQGILSEDLVQYKPLESDYTSKRSTPPSRHEGSLLFKFSKVVGREASCEVLDFSRYNVTVNRPPPINWPTQPNRVDLNNQNGLFIENVDFKRKDSGTNFSTIALYGMASMVIVLPLYTYMKRRRARDTTSAV